MSLVESVQKALDNTKEEPVEVSDALAEAEKLADQFSDVTPVPYVVPVEKFVGFTLPDRKGSL